MTKLTMTVVTAALLLVPGAALAKKPADAGSKSAAKECRAERDAMGRENFAVLYGSNKNKKNAFGKCVSRNVRENAEQAEDALKNASKECKAEEAADPTGFEATYGDPYTSNAFGQCVSTKVKADDTADATEFANAAKECKAERAADPAAFAATYGTGKKGRNALGKCVSSKVSA